MVKRLIFWLEKSESKGDVLNFGSRMVLGDYMDGGGKSVGGCDRCGGYGFGLDVENNPCFDSIKVFNNLRWVHLLRQIRVPRWIEFESEQGQCHSDNAIKKIKSWE